MGADRGRPDADLLGMPMHSTVGGDPFDSPAPAAHRGMLKVLGRRRRGIMRRSASLFLLPALIVALLAIYFWQRIVYVIPSGYAGVLYQTFFGGTVTDYVYPEGLHVFFPWDRLYDYDTRVQMVLSDITVLTAKGLPIELKLAIRYHPEYDMLGLLQQKVGPDYVQKIVLPQVESVLRRNIGKEEPEAIYTNKEGVLTDIISRAIEETSEKFVAIDDIIIREVILPEQVRAAIDAKLVYQQQAEAYEFRLAGEQKEAERKKIEAEGIRVYQDTVGKSLTADLLRWEYIKSMNDLSKSNNAKVVVTGSGSANMPLILPSP
jgi:regulator of protease activity HflC (stomatin/prohibitin superfamily)